MAQNSSAVRLFPPTAAYERSWLALSSDYLFEQATDKLEDRRAVVEQGLDLLVLAEEGPVEVQQDRVVGVAHRREDSASGAADLPPAGPPRRPGRAGAGVRGNPQGVTSWPRPSRLASR